MKVLHATSYVPFITTNKFKGVDINGQRYYDGAFSSKNIVNFNNDIPQLVFETIDVNYDLSSTFSFNDKFPEFIVLKGLIEFEKFICNIKENKHGDNKKFPFRWIESVDKINLFVSNMNLLDKNNKKSTIQKKDYSNDLCYDHINFKKKVERNKYIHDGGLFFLLAVSEFFFHILKK